MPVCNKCLCTLPWLENGLCRACIKAALKPPQDPKPKFKRIGNPWLRGLRRKHKRQKDKPED